MMLAHDDDDDDGDDGDGDGDDVDAGDVDDGDADDDVDDGDDGDADDIGDSKEQSVFWTRSGSRTTLRFCCKAMKKREILVSLLMSKNNPILFSLMEEILSDGRFSIFF